MILGLKFLEVSPLVHSPALSRLSELPRLTFCAPTAVQIHDLFSVVMRSVLKACDFILFIPSAARGGWLSDHYTRQAAT